MMIATNGYQSLVSEAEIDPAYGNQPVLVSLAEDGKPMTDAPYSNTNKAPAELVVPGDYRGGPIRQSHLPHRRAERRRRARRRPATAGHLLMCQRLAFALAVLLSTITLGPATSTAANLGDRHDRDRLLETMSTSVASATAPGPLTPNSVVSVTTGPPASRCAGDGVLVGGGTLTTGSTSNGLHLNGSVPSISSGSLDVTGMLPTAWIASGAKGNKAAPGATTTAFAMCLSDGPQHLRVIEADASGPAVPNSWTRATATCPKDAVVVGGGARTEPGTAGGLKPIGSFPGDASGSPVASMTVNPTSLTAVGLNGGEPAPGAVTRAFAVCARGDRIATRVVSLEVTGPTAAGSSLTTTVGCPTRGTRVLLGGNVYVTASDGILSTGVHLRGTYPSDSNGTPITSGTANAWTGVVHTGGQVAPGTDTTVFALCAQPWRSED